MLDNDIYTVFGSVCDRNTDSEISLSNLLGELCSTSELSTSYELARDKLGERAALLLQLIAGITARRVIDQFKFGEKNSEELTVDTLIATMIGYSHEVAFLLSLDKDGRAIAIDYLLEGSVNNFALTPRRLVERALLRSASRVIIAHNHPCGTAEPSDEDIQSTRRLAEVLVSADIRLDAHVIVSGLSASVMKLDRNNCDRVEIIRY